HDKVGPARKSCSRTRRALYSAIGHRRTGCHRAPGRGALSTRELAGLGSLVAAGLVRRASGVRRPRPVGSHTMIDVQHLTKNYASHRAITDVTFKVESSEVLGFLGPNGAGK